MLKKHLKLLICPDCLMNLKKIEPKNGSMKIGLCSKNCLVIYSIKDEIPIILAKEARNYSLEFPLIKKIKKELLYNSSNEIHQKSIKNTLNILDSNKMFSTWEWEDEKFWSNKYLKQIRTGMNKNWNDRIWQRESFEQINFDE